MQTDVDYVLCFTHLGFTCFHLLRIASSKTVYTRTRCFKTLYGYYLLASQAKTWRNDLMPMDSNLSFILSQGAACFPYVIFVTFLVF